MKVIHIFRGFEDYMIELMNIQATNMQVYAVIPQSSQWMRSFLDTRIIISDIKPKNVKSLSNILHIINLIGYIWRIKPDVIHIQAGVIWELILFLAFKTRIKVVTTIHDVTCHPSQDNNARMQKWIDYPIKHSNLLVCHTEEARQTINKLHGKINTHKIPHPIIKQYKPIKTHRKMSKLIFFGSLDKWKGLEILEQSIEYLQETPFELEIRGNSKFKAYYLSLFQKHKNVTLDIKRQSNQDIERLFSSGSALILPYIEASQSGVLHIAIHFKIPVIASRVGGIKELIDQHQLAIGFEPGNPKDLADKIKGFFINEELRTLIQNKQTLYENTHASSDAINALYEKIYAL